MSRQSLDSTTNPPPSYHSVDELREAEAWPTGSDSRRNNRLTTRIQNTMPQSSALGDEEMILSHRARDSRRRHHHSRRTPRPLGKSGTAKLALEMLKSNLMAASGHGQDRPPTSWRQKLDCSLRRQEVHYTVHNHWHVSHPAEPLPHSSTRMSTDPARLSHRPFTYPVDSVLDGRRVESDPVVQELAARDLRPSHAARLEDEISPAYWKTAYEQSDVDRGFYDFLGPSSFNTAKRERFGPFDYYGDLPVQAEAVNPPANVWRYDWNMRGPPIESNSYQGPQKPWEQFQCDVRDWGFPQNSLPWAEEDGEAYAETISAEAKSALDHYRQRWEYVDTIQRPHLHELPWPAIRPSLPFDHMKSDVFSFFARGCGLQADRSKASKLEFKLSARSPYPSFDQRQQEGERRMLKAFKKLMQREKLHWHEDKLRRKFPEAIGRGYDEPRKAVWAAIAEGSAVCDKKLSNML